VVAQRAHGAPVLTLSAKAASWQYILCQVAEQSTKQVCDQKQAVDEHAGIAILFPTYSTWLSAYSTALQEATVLQKMSVRWPLAWWRASTSRSSSSLSFPPLTGSMRCDTFGSDLHAHPQQRDAVVKVHLMSTARE
jgi:hypothetical protein